jgi:hypothetical protein
MVRLDWSEIIAVTGMLIGLQVYWFAVLFLMVAR